MINEVSQFKANRNRAHLINSNNHADTALQSTCQWLGSSASFKGDTGIDSLNSFRNSALKYLSDLDSERTQLKEQLEVLKRQVGETSAENSNQKGRLDIAIAEYQQQFSQN